MVSQGNRVLSVLRAVNENYAVAVEKTEWENDGGLYASFTSSALMTANPKYEFSSVRQKALTQR